MIRFNQTLALSVSLIALCVCVLAENANADNGRRQRYSAQQRAAIRATPILERPSRPMHFYGNAVRRNAANQSRQMNSVARKENAKTIDNSLKIEAQGAVDNGIDDTKPEIISEPLVKSGAIEAQAGNDISSASAQTNVSPEGHAKPSNFLLISLKKWLVTSDSDVPTED
jgi:hypothetical protein